MKNLKWQGDLVLDGENNFELVFDNDEIAQSIERVLTTNKNEWFLNLEHGLDYDGIWGKGKAFEIIKQLITEAILQVETVEVVSNLELILDEKRHLTVNGNAKLRNGTDVIIKEVVDFG